MELAVRTEGSLDAVETARLANEGFGSTTAFTPQRIAWLYGRAFSEPTTVLGLYAGERKVGQVALVRQRIEADGADAMAVALMDLFILPDFRSRDAIGALYGAVERFCRDEGIRFILAVPNGKAAGVNQKFLGLKPFLRLDIRAGVAAPLLGGTRVSTAARTMTPGNATGLFTDYLPASASGLTWTAERLWDRLQDPSADYGVHAGKDLLLISARRVVRHVPHTLLCAFFPRVGARATAYDVAVVTAAACRHQVRPLFVYAGLNAAVPLPGWSLPDRLRPSPMAVQIRDFSTPDTAVGFDRFEVLDFDFA